ncbi:hypothetical protein C8A05DRAFT_17360 [Staphylotrichum tortipilum]|uniref:Uncharacterized protein n=1 Tax=Staphylotrichum tortipilum TaxID=2831512 RepID=A0AAN6RRZ4_9PEZI|nr:hypothetical protein C8A05DRAFT_17360 [Staphylotrichum longicolle]
MSNQASGSTAPSRQPDNPPPNIISKLWPRRKPVSRYPPPVEYVVPPPAEYVLLTQGSQNPGRPPPQRSLGSIRRISPSVEPPRVSHYTLRTSPSPAHFTLPDIRPPTRTKSDLQTISETASGGPLPSKAPEAAGKQLERRPQTPNTHPQVSASAAHSQVLGSAQRSHTLFPGPSSASSHGFGFGPGAFHVIPRQPVMNPEGFKLGRTPAFAPSGPQPPEEFVLHAEVTRHGGVYVPVDSDPRAEASYQVDVTPPVPKQAPPRPIVMDAALFATPNGPVAPVRVQPRIDTNIVAQDPPSGATGSLVPPVSTLPMNSPLVGGDITRPKQKHLAGTETTSTHETAESTPSFYDTAKPTCSLNLVCYRSGARGCDLQQLQCVLRTLFPSDASFDAVITANPHLVHTDDQFFREMRRLYTTQMCGFFRRYFSLKTLRSFRLLAYTPTTRPTVVPFDDFVLQEMMYAYRNPDRLSTAAPGLDHGQEWVCWVFRLRRSDRRHALEFVEGWNTTRIAVSGSVPWLASSLVGIIWTAAGGDAQTAFTVASFILTSSSIMLALLAIISSVESSTGLSR